MDYLLCFGLGCASTFFLSAAAVLKNQCDVVKLLEDIREEAAFLAEETNTDMTGILNIVDEIEDVIL
jgi:hypothetical protein